MTRVTELLLKAEELRKESEERNSKTGESFNLLQSARVRRDNELMHSSVIVSLLDPNGKHGQGDKFLTLFLHQADISDFDTKRAKVYTEYYLGEAGRVDILIKSGNTAIVIENKLYAQDQPRQLWRYQKYFDKKECAPIYLIYLTPEGRGPSKDSLGNIDPETVRTISYSSNIPDWLKRCQTSLGDDQGYLKAALHTYELFINPDKGLKMKIAKEITTDAARFRAAVDIEASLNDARTLIVKKLFKAFENILKHRGCQVALFTEYNHHPETKQNWEASVKKYASENNIKYRFGLEVKSPQGDKTAYLLLYSNLFFTLSPGEEGMWRYPALDGQAALIINPLNVDFACEIISHNPEEASINNTNRDRLVAIADDFFSFLKPDNR